MTGIDYIVSYFVVCVIITRRVGYAENKLNVFITVSTLCYRSECHLHTPFVIDLNDRVNRVDLVCSCEYANAHYQHKRAKYDLHFVVPLFFLSWCYALRRWIRGVYTVPRKGG